MALLLDPSALAAHRQALTLTEPGLGLAAVQGRLEQQLLLKGTVPFFGAVPMCPCLGGGSWGSLTVCLAVLA